MLAVIMNRTAVTVTVVIAYQIVGVSVVMLVMMVRQIVSLTVQVLMK